MYIYLVYGKFSSINITAFKKYFKIKVQFLTGTFTVLINHKMVSVKFNWFLTVPKLTCCT